MTIEVNFFQAPLSIVNKGGRNRCKFLSRCFVNINRPRLDSINFRRIITYLRKEERWQMDYQIEKWRNQLLPYWKKMSLECEALATIEDVFIYFFKQDKSGSLEIFCLFLSSSCWTVFQEALMPVSKTCWHTSWYFQLLQSWKLLGEAFRLYALAQKPGVALRY